MIIQNTIQDLSNLKETFQSIAQQAGDLATQSYAIVDSTLFFQFFKRERAYSQAEYASQEETTMKSIVAETEECLDTLEAIKNRTDGSNAHNLQTKARSSLTLIHTLLHDRAELLQYQTHRADPSPDPYKQEQCRELARKVNKLSLNLSL